MKELMRRVLKNTMIFSRLFSCLVVFLLCLQEQSGELEAQTTESLDRLFTIRSVRVDVVASRASEARRLALAQAEQEAYGKLLRKITQPAGRALLPELTAPQIQALISGIEVVEEQSSARRYLAELDVRFEPSNVSAFLAEYGVPHVLGTGRGLIVLHAHSDGLTNFIWQPKSSTLAARAAVDWVNRIRTYVFPIGELRERAAMSYSEVVNFNVNNVKAIAGIYDVQSTLLIRSTWKVDSLGSGKLSYAFFSTDGDWTRDGTIEVQGSDAEEIAQQQMFEAILEEIDTAWRDQLLVDTGTEGDLVTLVPSTSLDILADIEKRLADVSLVRGVEYREIGLPFSRLYFHYTGRKEQLVMALRYAGLDLAAYGDQHILKIRTENGGLQ